MSVITSIFRRLGFCDFFVDKGPRETLCPCKNLNLFNNWVEPTMSSPWHRHKCKEIVDLINNVYQLMGEFGEKEREIYFHIWIRDTMCINWPILAKVVHGWVKLGGICWNGCRHHHHRHHRHRHHRQHHHHHHHHRHRQKHFNKRGHQHY